jgi:restriction system protein
MPRQRKGPRFAKYIMPVIDTLRELGGSGRPVEVIDLIAKRLSLSDEELNEKLPSGGESRFSNNVHWARFHLVKGEYLESSERGVWTLTEKGQKAYLTEQDIQNLIRTNNRIYSSKEAISQDNRAEDKLEEPVKPEPLIIDYRTRLMSILKKLPANGFERLCQRLLREAGFQKVVVTGRSGDGGIDGHGILQVNPFVSFQVLFQSKRYSGSVTVSQVRDFRGAMMGRTDKGIIITTGTFTTDARNEATREGVPPIELVDGEKLIDMFEFLKLGLKPRTVYEVDESFFDDFSSV